MYCQTSQRFATVGILLLALSVIMTACGGASAGIPPGTYTATFTAADNIQVGPELLTGSSSIEFREGGRYVISAPRVTLTGEFRVEGDQVSFDEDFTSFPCEGMDQYVYMWRLVDDQLIFETVDDACQLRVASMTTHPYVKQD